MSAPALSQDHAVEGLLHELQDQICDGVAAFAADAEFRVDRWTRDSGGGGESRILQANQTFDSAGVNFSRVAGDALPPAATARRPELAGQPFLAMGVSVVIHPCNPYVPTSHLNVRYFQAGQTWWFGGGFDLTPYYPFAADARAWHRAAQEACAVQDVALYPRFKQQCDEYFYLPHRQETRGIGGLFYDDWNSGDFEADLALTRAVATHYLSAYTAIVARRHQHPWGEREREFQRYRRGRYVEFNLLYDRGTLFGLQSGGRTESILMSLPPEVHWRYAWQPEAGSPEAALYADYLRPRDWLNADDPD